MTDTGSGKIVSFPGVGIAGTRHPLGTAVMMLQHRYAQRLLDA